MASSWSNKTNDLLQSYLPTENAIDVETVTEKTGVLPRSIGRTINKIKSDFNPKKEEDIVRKFRSSRAKTKTAVRFLLTLILVPLLTQLWMILSMV